mmetsp:Transcript_92012/g.237419  ORF Transcript_92012/g.237419 Transcript_92012/m.237419 type:complete len:445 (-) Transcript_92012:108-1442(-)
MAAFVPAPCQGVHAGAQLSNAAGPALRASVSCGASSAVTSGRRWQRSASFLGVALGTAGLVAQRNQRRRPRLQSATTRLAVLGAEGTPKKTVIITGASSGLGLATAISMAKTGEWCVIMACRDFQKGEKVAREAELPKGSYMVMHLDLAANNSVRQFVTAFRLLGRQLDALVCNAAVYFPNAHKPGAFFPGLFPGGGPRWSADGHELSFATNYLGHFLLCNLMIEDLKNSSVKPARCVILGTVTASINSKELGGMIPPLADVGQFQGLKAGMKGPDVTMVDGGKFNGAKAYKDSKVCDVMLMRELHKRFHASTGIVFSSLYPGCIAETALFREHYPVFQSLFPAFHQNVTRAYVSQEEAGRRLASVVSEPEYNGSGKYYSWQGKSGTGGEGGAEAKNNTEETNDFFLNKGSFRTLDLNDIGGEAGDDARAKKLWELSEKLVELA